MTSEISEPVAAEAEVDGATRTRQTGSTNPSNDAPWAMVRPIRFMMGPQFPGAVLALVFIWRSFIPTLMPRTWITQAAITAICAAIGYGLGMLAGYVIRQFIADRSLDARWSRAGNWMLIGGGSAVAVIGLWAWPRWQNKQRPLVGLGEISPLWSVPMLALAAVLTVVLVWFGRLIARGVLRLHRFNRRHLPAVVVSPATIVIVIAAGSFLLQDFVFAGFTTWANRAYSVVDEGTTPGTTQPRSALVSGGPGSPVGWATLGLQGRDFVSQATPADLLEAFAAETDTIDGTTEPIRVYAGLRSADDPVSRAGVVVDELRRTGAFEREVLVVTTVTGTGWVDPHAARSIELMYGGDTAIAALQYSYLPSWISMIVDGDTAIEAGAALYTAIHDEWSRLDPDQRPKLIAFGQSLGSFGAEAPFIGSSAAISEANLRTRSDGVLFTGPTNRNTMWRQFIDGREPGTPAWLPVFDGGETIRFADSHEDLTTVPTDWDGSRVLFVQHPSDPVVWGDLSSWQTSPDWMHQPRGGDVPKAGGWFPIVTWVQGLFDLMAGFSAPPGHGHDYRLAFPGAWSQVVPPEGWEADDIALLSAFLIEHPPPEAS
jgi:uncharacterized membrane protein